VPVELRLAADDDPHLEVVGPAGQDDVDDPLDERVLRALAREAVPMSRRTLRTRLSVRNTRLGEALNRLQTKGRLVRGTGGFALRP